MGLKVVISPTALEDLRDCFDFIARDNEAAAHEYCSQLIDHAEALADSPLVGRVCPEFAEPSIRDIVFRNHRIVYRFSDDADAVEIARFWHGARGYLPEEI